MSKRYERVEVTFSKQDEFEMKLYEYLENKSKVLGRGKYLKQLLYKEMLEEDKGSK